MSLEPKVHSRTQRIKSIYHALPVNLPLDSTRRMHIRKNPILDSSTNTPRDNFKKEPNSKQKIPSLQLNSINTPRSQRFMKSIVSTRRHKNSNASFAFDSSKESLRSVKASPRRLENSYSNANFISYPMSPSVAFIKLGDQLSEFEKTEIYDYQKIFFVSPKQKKIHGTHFQKNWGYDDERGDYNVVYGDHVMFRYEVISMLGRGAFGQVLKCLDHKTKQLVAVKIIRNKKRFHKQGAVEVKILNHLKNHDLKDTQNVVRMQSYFIFRKHVCIAFEMLSINLFELIKMNNYIGLPEALVRRFSRQILVSLKYTNNYGIIHCDLKPENILLTASNKSTIKTIDFGSSCFENERIYTYIQSRFYRAPEIMLGIPYTTAIDMWSFGCIVTELLTGFPLFPGESEQDQMLRIIEVLGPPPRKILEQSSRKQVFFDENKPRIVPNSKGKLRFPSTKPLQAFVGNEPILLDLLVKILDWDPEVRLLPEEALQHPWVTGQTTQTSCSPRRTQASARSRSLVRESLKM